MTTVGKVMVFSEVTILVLTIVICVYTFFRWKCLYWHNKGVPYIQPQFPWGTFENPFYQKNINAIVVQKQYHHLKLLGHKYGGLFSFVKPVFLVVDTKIIRNVLSKDFQYFSDRGLTYNEKEDPLSANLFKIEGDKWRRVRAKLTPTFSTSKIKKMFPTLVACAEPLRKAVLEFSQRNESIDIKDISSRYTVDVIGSCAFGIECNSFSEPESEFRKYGKQVFATPVRLPAFTYLFGSLNPSITAKLKMTKPIDSAKAFFMNTIKTTVEYRKQNKVVRNDFLQLLINLITDNGDDTRLTVEQVAAHAFAFFLGGFETSSTTMTFCLYELSVNPNIQQRVRDDINTTLSRYDGNITYDAVMEMKYLDNVIDETLRKYPPLGLLSRKCVQNYKIPDTDITIEKGTPVVIPIHALQHDPDYYSNPENFNPSRFNKENRSNIGAFTFMPFGEGPRMCIALRFGLLETKVGLITLLKDMKFTLNPRTKSPIEFDLTSIIISANGGVWLDIEKVL